MFDIFQEAIVISMLAATLRIATPLLLASIGELVVQRTGIWNLGVEGTMLMATYVAYTTALASDSLLLGVLAAIVAGICMNMVMALAATTFKINQFVTGLGLNLFAAGTTLVPVSRGPDPVRLRQCPDDRSFRQPSTFPCCQSCRISGRSCFRSSS